MPRVLLALFLIASGMCQIAHAEYNLVKATELSTIDGLNAFRRQRLASAEERVARLFQEERLSADSARDLIDLYVENGFLQEAIWLSRKVGESKTASKLQKHLRDILTKQQPERVWRFANSSGIAPSSAPMYLLKMSENVFAIFKGHSDRTEDASFESLAFEVDQHYEFDLVPAAYSRSMFGIQNGAILYFVRHGHQVFEGDPHAKSARLRIFDFLIGNVDRGGQNPNYLLWLSQLFEAAFDNGAGFESLSPIEYLNHYFIQRGLRLYERNATLFNGELKELAASGDLELLERPSENLFKKLSGKISGRRISSMKRRLKFLRSVNNTKPVCARWLSKAQVSAEIVY